MNRNQSLDAPEVISLLGLYANADQKEKALETLKKAETMFQEMGMDYWLAETRRFWQNSRSFSYNIWLLQFLLDNLPPSV
jgi:hypothetical protein